ncbi:flagellar hook-associated protein 3 FlgL [Desulfurobacterium pacificum]|uniref:Flagellar hook-associated protein 3 FlgL n=1 Tax=Desulfurobacterium pacificum TaxID=240166 RepID=A0ABY1NXH6_9BACT|nr:flagellar hook-associated protein FlgL [Desulfurobacterium pacificum]SMP18556.1 flagellar hook-associated protein 3 FlgL [Desulfurobacterium pacificum]
MRVPDIKFFDLFLKYDRERETTLQRKTEELSSGKQLLYPSDNPVDAARVLRFKRLISTFERFNRNIDFAKTSLENGESVLDTVVNTLQEARAKIVQVMNTGIINEEDAKTLVDYFKAVKEYIINQANFKIGDNYIFGGVKVQDPPFDSDGTYNGSTNVTTVAVANGVEVNLNFNGAEAFGVNSTSGKITSVEVIDQIINIIESGNINQLNTATIIVDGTQMKLLDAFDKGLNQIMEYRSILGTQIATVENLKTQNENLRLHYSDLVSKLENADYAQTISEYEKAKTAYDALLAAIQQTKDLSLLKYYR